MALKVIFSAVAAQDPSRTSPLAISCTANNNPLTELSLYRSRAPVTGEGSALRDKPFRKAVFVLGLFGGIFNFLCAIAGIVILSIYLPYTITLAVLTAWLILASILSISTGLSLAKALGFPPATPNRDFRLDYLLRFAALVSTLSILVGTAAFLHGLILLLQMTHQSLARDDTEELIEQMDSMGLYDVAEAVQNQTKKNRQVAGSSSTAVGLVAFLINMVALSVVWKSRRTARDERRNRAEDIGVSVIGMPDNVPPPPTYAAAIANSGAETPIYPMPEPPPRYTAS
ncbi:uncharacterized protein LOC129592779 [Paramacrobiotus metropolitanus]|uniref:uncharacterized protein LOC129592779 n=1 Tax=Paramacrobiotus metropolitanus TaxID=2943436 RepID=UPI0024460CD5|nr:uncharacterized protein LOC129592779 [Paramacrobiotus metropolitanus]